VVTSPPTTSAPSTASNAFFNNFFLDGVLDNTAKTLSLNSVPGQWFLRGTIVGGTITAASAASWLAMETGSTLDGVTLATTPFIYYGSTIHVKDGLRSLPARSLT